MVLVLATHPTRGSSIARYIDALLASLRAHPELQAPEVCISDGLPARDLSFTHLITVGGQDEPTAQGDQEPAQLGAQRREETYTVQVYCSAQVGGHKDASQKAARDQAFALLRVVEEVLQRDPTMSQQNDGAALVRYSDIRGGITLAQTGPQIVEELIDSKRPIPRWAEVAVQITVRNRIELQE
jgi:hypothetical protein